VTIVPPYGNKKALIKRSGLFDIPSMNQMKAG
jgi:hypothetical protein